jgi:glycosyltransferase involved in cell wall biosynthesis
MHKRDFVTLNRVIEIVTREDKSIHFNIVTSRSNDHLFARQVNVNLYCDMPEVELVRLYQDAALLIQPLLGCTANNAILEGMSCALPIVATDVGGVRDYVTERCALLTPLGDANAMASAILNLLANPQQRVQMGKEARSRALQFDWEQVATEMRRVYEMIL